MKLTKDRINLIVLLTFILALTLIILSCGQKTIGISEMQTHYDQVKKCMGGIGSVPAPKLQIEEGDSVTCNGVERRGCYSSDDMTIRLPENSDTTTIRHEYVHHLLFVTTGDLDKDHSSEYFLNCSGVIIENDAR